MPNNTPAIFTHRHTCIIPLETGVEVLEWINEVTPGDVVFGTLFVGTNYYAGVRFRFEEDAIMFKLKFGPGP